MKKRALMSMLLVMAVLILDSRCAAESAREALQLCIQTLIPGLFPMFVLSAMLVPQLSRLRVPGLSRILGIPSGCEGILLLGCTGGFPVGAACIVQAVGAGSMDRQTARRMLGIASFCGPAFLFGVLGNLFSVREAGVLFAIQLETAMLVCALRPSDAPSPIRPAPMAPVSLPDALKRATTSLTSVCAWVTLAAVAAGFLRRWLAPLLPEIAAVILTGALELTTGVFSLSGIDSGSLRFLLCAGFVCFGGVSVLLQIGGLAADAELRMAECVAQKCVQGLLGLLLAWGYLSFGLWSLLVPLLVPMGKIAVEISGRMVYNGPRKEGI